MSASAALSRAFHLNDRTRVPWLAVAVFLGLARIQLLAGTYLFQLGCGPTSQV